jgi:hypothetical protein
MHVWRNIEARSRNNCCRWKAVSIAYFCVCVCVQGVWGCRGAGVCLCACSVISPARNAPPYCHLRPLWLHKIFRHYLINGMIFGKKLLNIKCVLIFSTKFFETFLILRYIVINVKSLHVKYKLFLSEFNGSCIFSTDFLKSIKLKFHQNPFSGSRSVPCGRTDGRTWS